MKRGESFKVGVFDSGVGGLTVLYECVRLLPQVKFYYLGDNEHAPYGSRSEEEIIFLVEQALQVFAKKGVDAVVLACNTVTAVAAERLRREFPFPVVGIEPAIKPAAAQCKNILVLVTPRTAGSMRLSRLISAVPQCAVTVFPAPDLAGAIEQAVTHNVPLNLSSHLPKGEYDGIVLGCTHYIYFKREIGAFYSAPVFDGNFGTAKRLASVLKQEIVGTADHQKGEMTPNNNLQFSGNKRVKFLGNSAKINEYVFKQTNVFKK